MLWAVYNPGNVQEIPKSLNPFLCHTDKFQLVSEQKRRNERRKRGRDQAKTVKLKPYVVLMRKRRWFRTSDQWGGDVLSCGDEYQR